MARITSATSAASLFFFLATLISHVLTLPLLQRDGVNQLKVDLELFTGDLTSLDQAMYIGPANSGHQWLALSPQNFASAFSTTTNDLKTCIKDVNSIARLDEADAKIVLKLATDFTPKITGMLGNLRRGFSTFKRLDLVTFILNQVRTLDSGMTELMDNLKNVIPRQSQSETSSLQQQMGPAFQKTISLYESS